MSRLQVWWKAFRWNYFTYIMLPAAIAATVAWSEGWTLSFGYTLAALCVAVAVHLGYELANDVYDYRQFTRLKARGERVAYSGGSGLIASGELDARSTVAVMALCYVLLAACGILLTFSGRPYVLGFIAAGGALSWFYSAPPRLSYRGLGEMCMLLSFGPIQINAFYYMFTGGFSVTVLVVSFVVGLAVFAQMILNEIPDHDEDKDIGKRNLVVRMGIARGRFLFAVTITLVLAAVAAGALLRSGNRLSVLLFAPAAFFGVRAVVRLYRYKDRVKKLWGPNLDMIKCFFFLCLGLILFYMAQGLAAGLARSAALVIVGSIAALCTPTLHWLVQRSREDLSWF